MARNRTLTGKPDPNVVSGSNQINPKFLDPGGPRSDDDEDYKGEWRDAVDDAHEMKREVRDRPDPNAIVSSGQINPKFIDPAGPRVRTAAIKATVRKLK